MSAVLTPGRQCRTSSSVTLLRASPARRMIPSSCGVLRLITSLWPGGESSCGCGLLEGFLDGRLDVGDRAQRIDLPDEALAPVVLDHRHGVAQVDRDPGARRFLVVVRPLDQGGAVERTDARHRRRVELGMEGAAALGAGEAAGEALREGLLRRDQGQGAGGLAAL